MLETFLSIHWGWYIPMYFATGIVLTAMFIAMLPTDSDLHRQIVKYNTPPAVLIAILWPLSLIVGASIGIWFGLDGLFQKAANFDPQKLNPRHRFRKMRHKLKASKQTEAEAVGEAVPSWARWE